MTIKKRIAISNVLMIVVPIIITAVMAVGCDLFICYQVTAGTGLDFEDSESFYEASSDITDQVEETLKYDNEADRQSSMKTIGSLLDQSSMSLTVTADGDLFYQYGNDPEIDSSISTAISVIGNEGVISVGENNLRAHTFLYNGTEYVIYLSGIQTELSYYSLKVALIITFCILILTIIFAVYLTDRFLTRFVFRHVEEPLNMLSAGVEEIGNGNLDYRLVYTEEDEFLPICNAFNQMAERLQSSVEQTRKEEENRKELMADISHDLRTPLTSIQAYVEGLLDGIASTPEMQMRYLQTIKKHANELDDMVTRILDYSRMEMNDSIKKMTVIKLDEVILNDVKEVQEDYAERGLAIETDISPIHAYANEEDIRQLIINLADNSLKYKVKDRGKLYIELKGNDDHYILSFSDDGPGVPKESLNKLFDLFYRTDQSRGNEHKGSGLGLTIVEKTVMKMGGTVHAENIESGGLRIYAEFNKGGNSDAKNSDH